MLSEALEGPFLGLEASRRVFGRLNTPEAKEGTKEGLREVFGSAALF